MRYDDQPFQGVASVQTAYLLPDPPLARDAGAGVTIHKVDIHGDYYEIDTTEDYEIVCAEWR